MSMKRLCLVLAALWALGAAPALAQQPQDHTELVAPSDPEMNAAIAHARETLPRFWAAYDAHNGQDFMLKVAFPIQPSGAEHIWIDAVVRQGDHFTGTLADEPEYMPGLHFGSPVTFTEDQISDWMVGRAGRIYGFFTTRVLFSRLTGDERAQYAGIESALSDDLP